MCISRARVISFLSLVATLNVKHHVGTGEYRDVSRFGVQKVARPSLSTSSVAISPTHASSSLSPRRTVRQSRSPCRGSAPRSSLIMNRQRHLPLFIVVRSRLIYRRDSRAYYSRFLFQRLRTYYSAVRLHFVFYRRASVRSSVRKPIDKIHIVTSYRIKSRLPRSDLAPARSAELTNRSHFACRAAEASACPPRDI